MMEFCRFLLVLFSLRIAAVESVAQVNCVLSDWSSWSGCDPCSKTQNQLRSVLVYPQFFGTPCSSHTFRSQPCETTQHCPLHEGCGNRFRCQSGICVSQSMRCNGDRDCEDGSDERNCTSQIVCNIQKPLPMAQLGLGYDVTTHSYRGSVINTLSLGGQCREIFSENHQELFRLPESTLNYTFQVTAKNDFSSEMFESSLDYKKSIVKREETTGTTRGHNHFTSNEDLKKQQSKQLVLISRDVEVARVQAQAPGFLPLSEDFWKHLTSLPVVYDYAAYRQLLDRFGTHYLSAATLGGELRVLLHLSRDFVSSLKTEVTDFEQCVTETHTVFFFIKCSTTNCSKLYLPLTQKFKENKTNNFIKSNAVGGHSTYIAKLNALDVSNPEENLRTFSRWAGSVKDYPTIISQKLAPLYELVKEVSCAELKKFYLKRAMEAYMMERDSCRCAPCYNNGLSVLEDGQCVCLCKPGTDGVACEIGSPLDEQQGVIHGGWSCWTDWGSCSGGQRRRTRVCNRPAPRNGENCNGNSEETKLCDEEEELQYLRSMQPHCFDQSLEPVKSCGDPPALINGFVVNPKDFYAIGKRIEYSCIDGYNLMGQAIAECTEEATWRKPSMECKRNVCNPPLLSDDLMGTPWKLNYSIGESILLNCSAGRKRTGPEEIHCNSGLSWSPKPKNTKCTAEKIKKTMIKKNDGLMCEPWQNKVQNKCVCKSPNQCIASLEVCVSRVDAGRGGRSSRMSVCQLRAQQCLGRQFVAAEPTTCRSPEPVEVTCPHCPLWMECDAETQTCRCKTLDECLSSESWINICVRLSENATVTTVTECEVGVRQCREEKLQIVSFDSCAS